MEKCFQEAVRYLGYGKNPVDEATSRLVEKGFLELEKVSALRSVFRIFEMNRDVYKRQSVDRKCDGRNGGSDNGNDCFD